MAANTRNRREFDIYPKPGPTPGMPRVAGAPNNGAMGGRPASSSGVTSNNPMEILSSTLPVFPAPPNPNPREVPPPAPPVAGPGGEAGMVAPGPGQIPPRGTPAPAPQPKPQPSPQPQPREVPPPAPPVGPGAQPAPSPGMMPMPRGELWPQVPVAPGPTPMLDQVNPQPPPPAQFHTVPHEADLGGVVEGQEIQTPLGVGRKRGTGIADGFRLNEQGRQAYAHAKAKRVEKFGKWPLMDDPRAPQPTIEPGKIAYNPFAPPGQEWSED